MLRREFDLERTKAENERYQTETEQAKAEIARLRTEFERRSLPPSSTETKDNQS